MSRIVIVILIYHRHKPIDKTGRWIMSRIVTAILIYHRHKPIDSINLLGS
jgi:hypothetical protein